MKKFISALFALFLLVSCGGDDPEPEVRLHDGTLGGACYPNKTCNDGLVCSEENICVRDGNGGGNGNHEEPDGQDPAENQDGDSGDSAGNDPSEGGDTGSDDENVDADSAPDDDQGETGEKCGNGTKDAGEVCEKGEYVKCSEVNSQYDDSNFAICNSYCNGWNTDACSDGSNVPARATFPAVSFEVDYLYHGADAFNKGANQDNEKYKTALFETTIPLEDGSVYSIPHPQANTHWISAYYIDNEALVFNQSSYLCAENSGCQGTTPMIEFYAALSDLSAGKKLPMGISDKYKVNFLVEDNENDCVLLVGYGTLTVDSVNISAGSAGHFKFTTSEIGLYSVTMTPEGDVTNELEEAKYTICK